MTGNVLMGTLNPTHLHNHSHVTAVMTQYQLLYRALLAAPSCVSSDTEAEADVGTTSSVR